jgi:hypothetical protein
MPPETPDRPGETEGQIERLSEDLKDQMRLARDRIADRYVKLMEERAFETAFHKDD